MLVRTWRSFVDPLHIPVLMYSPSTFSTDSLPILVASIVCHLSSLYIVGEINVNVSSPKFSYINENRSFKVK